MKPRQALWRFTSGLAVVIGLILMITGPSNAIDWNSVQGKDIVLFYPGQASWEWALTQSDHSGAKKFREGKKCRECHRGEERKIGELIVSGRKLEPHPTAGKRGSIGVNVKMAHDGERLHIRLAWEAGKRGGGPKMNPKFESMATVMIDDGHLVSAKRAGCWGACHDDAIGMASAKQGQKLTKYLAGSRTKITRQGGGESYKPKGDLDQLLSKGLFLEYWQARLNRGAAAVAVDGYILDKRHETPKSAIAADGKFDGGKWVTVLSRPLKPGQTVQKDIVPGSEYTLGFAVHDDYSDHRYHHISLGYTMVLDKGKADFVAVKQ
jgi:hypothetical protein